MTRSCICTSDAPPLWTSYKMRDPPNSEILYTHESTNRIDSTTSRYQSSPSFQFPHLMKAHIVTNRVLPRDWQRLVQQWVHPSAARSPGICPNPPDPSIAKGNHVKPPAFHRSPHFTAPLRGQCRYPKPKRTHSVSPNPRPQKGGIQGTQIFDCKVESWIK